MRARHLLDRVAFMVERPPHLIRLVVCSAAALLCSAPASHAQRLPLTTYTTANGLAGNEIAAAVEDARGFLWIGTERGLSRFDGKEFRTFGKERGLTDERVRSVNGQLPNQRALPDPE